MGTKYGQLDESERVLIWKWQKLGLSKRKIAKELSRSASTISRELRRNKVEEESYEPGIEAQRIASERKSGAGKRIRLKSEFIRKFVEDNNFVRIGLCIRKQYSQRVGIIVCKGI